VCPSPAPRLAPPPCPRLCARRRHHRSTGMQAAAAERLLHHLLELASTTTGSATPSRALGTRSRRRRSTGSAPLQGDRVGPPWPTVAILFEIRPPPSVSTVGEHVYAIPSISSLRFVFHPCPSSPVGPAIRCARSTYLCVCAPVRLWIEPEVEDKAILQLDPWRKRKSLPMICVLYLLRKTPYRDPTFPHKARLSPFIDLTQQSIHFASTI
jgi:hypothetical protein